MNVHLDDLIFFLAMCI